MSNKCIRNAEISITCRQFFNPITPEEWSGFSVTIYDSQLEQRVIERTVEVLKFDARTFSPMIMPAASFTVDPGNATIATYSTWSLSLQVNIPLQTGCYIRISLPNEFTFNRQGIEASGIFMNSQLDTQLRDEDWTLIERSESGVKAQLLFQGCNDEQSLGRAPFGRLDISSIKTQAAIMDSQTFQVEIYQDRELTRKIAVLADGVIISSSQLKPGNLFGVSIKPDDLRVQRISPLTLTFTISNQLGEFASLLIRLPSGLQTPQGGSILNIVSPNSLATKATVLPGNMIEIVDLVQADSNLPAGTELKISVFGIANQNSVRDAGDYEITTKNRINGQSYTVDSTIVKSSFVATTGAVDAIGQMKVPNPTNYLRSNIYSLTFDLEDPLPKAGYIMIQLPEEIRFSPSTTQSSGSCKLYTCTFANATTVILLVQQGIKARQQVTLDIGGIINPRSFKPSGPIIITTLDTDADSQIDSGYSQTATMSTAGTFDSFSVQQQSFINGETTTYTFAMKTDQPMVVGDQLVMNFPAQLGLPKVTCKGLKTLLEVLCKVSERQLTMTIVKMSQAGVSLAWEVSGIKNPSSTKTSDPFTNIMLIDNAGFKISDYKGEKQTVTNKFPAQLKVYNISQESLVPLAITSYTITFEPVNQLPQAGSIQVTYPSQILLTEGASTACTVTTKSLVSKSACKIDAQAQTITIQGLFAKEVAPYSSPITIQLDKVQNALNNKPGNGFVIQTYADESQTYIIDKLNDFILTPLFECEYPCRTCSASNRRSCLECWPNFDDPGYLMFYPDGTASCRSFCDPGHTTNGNQKKHCQRCDASCGTCAENGLVGDAKKCIDCAPDYRFRLSMTQTCLKDCEMGMYRSTNTSCSLCRDPCEGCEGTETTCNKCFKTSAVSQLFGTQCINECPLGYVSVDHVCEKCQSPCATCSGAPDQCDTCDGTGGTKFTFQKKCFVDCPPGSAPNVDTMTCFKCLPGCDLCDLKNQTKCLKCTTPTLAYEGECLTACPPGWHPNEDITACRPWQLSDLGTLPYPFLIAAVVGTVVCSFGMMKKRAYILHGKMAKYSPQNTLTCLIVIIAPLQFFATIAQWILSYVYGTTTFCILTAMVTLAAIAVNIAFQIMFVRNFDSKRLPVEIDRKVRLDKMKKEESLRYLGPRDEKFTEFKSQHAFVTYTIFTLSATINYKFNKIFYSFLFDFQVFQAPFSRVKVYRKLLTLFTIVYAICVDLALVCIDITALTQIERGNQLHITLTETLVLSILSIILSAIELMLLKRTMSYTEPPKSKNQLKGLKSDDSDDDNNNLDKKYDKRRMAERRELMIDLLRQVKQNKQLFLNNKLDELICAFGDRRCKSMMDLGTGMDLEDDPQERLTYPVSPRIVQDFMEMDVQFSHSDAYNDVEGNRKLLNDDVKDQRSEQLREAMRRKEVAAFNQDSFVVLDDLRRGKKTRRRGRKNKFHAQIEQEDQTEIDQVEASDDEQKLQIIREQEQEEEQLQKVDRQQKQQLQQLQKELEMAEKRDAYQQSQDALQKQQSMQQQKRDSEAKYKQQELARQQQLKREELEQIRIDKQREQRAQTQLMEKKQSQVKIGKKAAVVEVAQAPVVKVDKPTLQNRRLFNQYDIMGKLEYDGNGNPVVPESRLDQQGRPINQKGYLIDKDNNIIENLDGTLMFSHDQLDEKGEIPQPYNLERFNFNAHDVFGDFDYKNKKPQIISIKNTYQDKKGRPCTRLGWLTDASGDLVDVHGRKKLNRKVIGDTGDLQKLYNLHGKRFELKDVMGQFDRDQYGQIVIQSNPKGLLDSQGRLVNEKGYLVDRSGNIINQNGLVIWKYKDLQRGEFIKIFPFTKFNLVSIQASKELGEQSGETQANGISVNQKGYMCDGDGNIVDRRGCVVFEKAMLDKDDIPAVFRSGILQGEKSEISRLMDQIEKDVASDAQAHETSLDSQMENTPANYNHQNQAYSQDPYQGVLTNRSVNTVSKKKLVEVLQPTDRDKEMADAYGGQPLGSIKRPGIKYDKKRLKDSMKFRISAEDEPSFRANLSQLVNSASRTDALQPCARSGSRRESVAKQETVSQKSSRPHYEERKLRAQKKPVKDGDFQQLFGKDLDQFLEDSEWDMKSIDKVSIENLRQIEKEYLDAEFQPRKKLVPAHSQVSTKRKSPSPGREKGKDRETVITYTDDPRQLHHAEILPFNTSSKGKL